MSGMRGFTALALAAALAGCGSAHIRDAEKSYGDRDYRAAYEAYERARAEDPESVSGDAEVDAHYQATKKGLARILYDGAKAKADGGDLNGALEDLKRARDLDPSSIDVEEAIRSTEARKADRREKAKARYAAGLDLERKRDWYRAFDEHDGAVKLDPNHFRARARRQAVAAERARGEALFADGTRCEDEKRLLAAVVPYRRCKEASPFHPRVDEALRRTQGNLEEAKHYLNEADAAFKTSDLKGAWLAVSQSLEAYPRAAPARKLATEVLLRRAEGAAKEKRHGSALLDAAEAYRIASGAAPEEDADILRPVIERVQGPLRAYDAEVMRRNSYDLSVRLANLSPNLGVGRALEGELMAKLNEVRPPSVRNVGLLRPDAEIEPGDLGFAIEVVAADVPMPTESREPMSKRYIAYHKKVPNPAYADAEAAVLAAETAYAAAREISILAQLAAEIPLAAAKAKRARTPREIDEPVYEDHHYNIITVKKLASVTLRIESPTIPIEAEWSERAVAQDTTIDSPNPKAEVAPDPLELPGDQELIQRAVKKLAASVAGGLVDAAQRHVEGGKAALAADAGAKGDFALEMEHRVDAAYVRTRARNRVDELPVGLDVAYEQLSIAQVLAEAAARAVEVRPLVDELLARGRALQKPGPAPGAAPPVPGPASDVEILSMNPAAKEAWATAASPAPELTASPQAGARVPKPSDPQAPVTKRVVQGRQPVPDRMPPQAPEPARPSPGTSPGTQEPPRPDRGSPSPGPIASSQARTVRVALDAPVLRVDPVEAETFSPELRVAGHYVDHRGLDGLDVYVNRRLAGSVEPADLVARFTVRVTLAPGRNDVEVVGRGGSGERRISFAVMRYE